MVAASLAAHRRKKAEEAAKRERERRKALGLIGTPPTAGDADVLDILKQKVRRTVDTGTPGVGDERNYRRFDTWRARKGKIT
jgi:hypothetical protein